MSRLAISFIRLYQLLSAWMPPVCRFEPSCSNYALVALRRHGFFRGMVLGAWRILRCHPFNPGGLDPVPPNGEELKKGLSVRGSARKESGGSQ